MDAVPYSQIMLVILLQDYSVYSFRNLIYHAVNHCLSR